MKRLRILLSLVGLLAVVPTAARAQDRVEPVAGLAGEAGAIVAGPDGAMWASLTADPGRIARITTNGAVVYVEVGGLAGFPVNQRPAALASHRGAVWVQFADGPSTFARLRIDHALAGFSLQYGRPTSLVGGPDGALWMTVAGDPGQPDAITRFRTDPPDEQPFTLAGRSGPRSIVAGPDGALWFVEGAGGRLGRITTSGALSYEPVGAAPTALAADGAGSLWYAQGDVVHRLGDPVAYPTGSPVTALAAGPDGAMWAAVQGGVVRIVGHEAPEIVSEGIDPAARGLAIAAGPDGRMWMTLDRAPYLVKVTVPPLVDDVVPEADGWLSARVNANGLEADARAELRQPDGSWRTLDSAGLDGTASATTVRLRLGALPPGEHVLRVTATSSAGSASSPAITIGHTVEPAPAPNPVPAASPTPAPASGPVEGKSVEVGVLSGTVSYRIPPSTTYTALKGTAVLPLGVLLDTSDGKVRVASQVDGATQAGAFDSGKFSVTQTATGVTEMALAGPLDCSSLERARISAGGKKKKKKRLLWGKDSGGSFRTRGNGSVATVRGTEWRTEDTCAGTTIYVRKGEVSVWPRRGGRSKVVRAGQQLFSPRPR